MKRNQLKLAVIIGFIGLVILTTGVTYSIFVANNPDENIQVMTTGKAKIEISDEVFPTFTELVPLTDEEGLNETNNSYSFTISNVGDTKINYKLYLIDNQIDGAEILSDEYIKTSVVINGKNMGIKRLSEVNEAINNTENTGRLLNDKDLTTKSESESSSKDSYVIKIWLDNERIENMSDAEKMELDDKALSLKLKVVATQVFDINAEYVPPEIGISIDNITTNSFRITAGTVPTSDSNKIESYEFSCDGETPVPSSNNTYICTNVKTGLHNSVQARAKDIKKSYIYSSKAEVTIPKIEEPVILTDNAGWSTNKTITVTCPENTNNYTYQYKIGNGEWIDIPSGTVEIPLTGNGSVTVKISDGTNTIIKEYIEDKIDNENPVCTWSGPYTTVDGNTTSVGFGYTSEGYFHLDCVDTLSGINSEGLNTSEVVAINDLITVSFAKTTDITNGKRYTFKITGMASSGETGLKVNAGAVKDLLNHGNAAVESPKVTLHETNLSKDWKNYTEDENNFIALYTLDTKNLPDTKEYNGVTYTLSTTVDVSEQRNNNVRLGTYVNGSNKIAVMGQEGGVVAPVNSYGLFASIDSTTKYQNIYLNNFDTSKVTNMHIMFYNCTELISIDVSNFDTRKVTDMAFMFAGGSGNKMKLTSITGLGTNDKFNTSNVVLMNQMFQNCEKLTDLSFGNYFDTSKVVGMDYMFTNCSSLTNLDLSRFNASAVGTGNISYTVSGETVTRKGAMANMFSGCTSLQNITFGSLFKSTNVLDMSFMFNNCSSLSNIYGLENFTTSTVKDMRFMFNNCSSLTSLNLTSFNTSSVENMHAMFQSCSSLTNIYGLESFITSSVQNMAYMFYGCSSLTSLNLTSFNTTTAANYTTTSGVNGMAWMFSNCTGLQNTAGTTVTATYGNFVWNANTSIGLTSDKFLLS